MKRICLSLALAAMAVPSFATDVGVSVSVNQPGLYGRIDIGAVPVMDATGMVNLESALDRLHRDHTLVILARVQDQPAKFMARAGIEPEPGLVAFADSVEEAVHLARSHTTRSP